MSNRLFNLWMKPYLHQNHSRPVTRRELMAQGFLGSSAAVFAPALASLGSKALAADGAALIPMVPYLIFDLEGGAALPGNFLVGNRGGPLDLLRSYDLLGWNPRDQGNPLFEDFGLPMSRNQSKMLAGILQVASASALANFRMGSFCHFAQDDSGSNRSSPIGALYALGAQGRMLKAPLGTRRTVSGGRSDVNFVAPMRPLVLNQSTDLGAALSYGNLVNRMSTTRRALLAKALRNISVEQVRQSGASIEISDRMREVLTDNELLTTSGLADFDARNDPIFSSIYGISGATPSDSMAAISATVCKNVLKGTTGPGVITIAGCDYHTGRQEDGDLKDLEIGLQIGAAVEAAHRLQSPLFIQILTDGGIYPIRGTRIWAGDAGFKGMTIIGFYHPGGAPAQRRIQVGHYTDGQGAERATLVGSEPARVAWAVFANYLNIMGMVGRMDEFARGVFSSADLDSLLIFG